MKFNEIRETFLEYFRKKGHTIVSSSSLIPEGDPSLLFTNAGMVQFKRVFLGEEERSYRRAASSQKCIRAGGKHNDLEKVGFTVRHHTFFEMLGNFSFGDYFKEEAIEMAWDFLTREVNIQEQRLFVSVFEDDHEAFKIWREKIGVPAEKIFKMGEKDNFWSMGETGPCGPCSEIIIDQGKESGCGRPDCQPGCDCDRFLELWNLVFMQFYRDQDGTLTPLPKPCIDTGMGLERIAAILQGVKSNYDTDVFRSLISSIEDISSQVYGEDAEKDISFRVIADHSRAATFIICDGVFPSNEGRGYVLRRIIRRALRHGKKLGIEGPFLTKICGQVVDLMEDAYPEIREKQNYMAQAIFGEEERFSETLDSGLKILMEEIEKAKDIGIISGEAAFRLYDTYGFPLDLTIDIVNEYGLKVDEEGYHREMELQKKRARLSWPGEELKTIIYKNLLPPSQKVFFVGYEKTETRSHVLKIIKDNQSVDGAKQGDEVEVITHETPFYGQAGGQVGDKGFIFNDNFSLKVEDTSKPLHNLTVHKGRLEKGVLRVGDEVVLRVDEKLRKAAALNHTATHLLHFALRKTLGGHVRQMGSLVEPARLRFDFSHFSPLDRRTLERIEDIVNEKIMDNLPVQTQILSFKEALDMGAIALFEEKYSEKVRMVRIEDFSMELCGGTHASRTGDLGLFKIVGETGVAAGIRRIEALTGMESLSYVRKMEREREEIASALKTSPAEMMQKLNKFLSQQKSMEKELEALRRKLSRDQSSELLSNVKEVKGIKVLSSKTEAKDPKELRELADHLKERIKEGIIVLGGKKVEDKKGKAFILALVSKNLIPKFSAGEIVNEIASVVGGRGGGKPDMAQAGGDKPERLEEALGRVYEIVERRS